jgi:plasmid stabilization system protein ParE
MASMPAIEFHPGARADYDESFDWYAQRSHRAAVAYALAIEDAIERIVSTPDRFPLIDDIHRECIVQRFPYRIIFREFRNQLVIVAVAHAKRRPTYWRNRSNPQP